MLSALGRIRTCDRRIRSPLLCPAELRARGGRPLHRQRNGGQPGVLRSYARCRDRVPAGSRRMLRKPVNLTALLQAVEAYCAHPEPAASP